MSELFNCVMTKHALAFGVGGGIFLITILLVATRMIGLVLSIILMLIALGATLVLDRPDAASYWNQYTPEQLHIHESEHVTPAPANTTIKKTSPAVPKEPSASDLGS
jgi:hypothetical protein